jgi:hypothetical protein
LKNSSKVAPVRADPEAPLSVPAGHYFPNLCSQPSPPPMLAAVAAPFPSKLEGKAPSWHFSGGDGGIGGDTRWRGGCRFCLNKEAVLGFFFRKGGDPRLPILHELAVADFRNAPLEISIGRMTPSVHWIRWDLVMCVLIMSLCGFRRAWHEALLSVDIMGVSEFRFPWYERRRRMSWRLSF